MEDGELVTIKEITRIDKNGDKIVKKFKNNKESKYWLNIFIYNIYTHTHT